LFDIATLVGNTAARQLTNTMSGAGQYQILQYLTNVTQFDLSGTGLTQDIDTTIIPQATLLDIQDTKIKNVQFANSNNISIVKVGTVQSLVLNNCPSIEISLTYTDKS